MYYWELSMKPVAGMESIARTEVRNSPQIKPTYCYIFTLKTCVLANQNAEIVLGLFLILFFDASVIEVSPSLRVREINRLPLSGEQFFLYLLLP